MELKISSEFDPKKIQEALSKVEKKRWPKILSYASTETAFYVRNKLRSEMPKYIDKPKPFTLNSIFVKKGSTKDQDATVQWRKPSGGTSGGRYLKPLVEGGGRQAKGFERKLMALGVMDSNAYAIPTKDNTLDQYGNVPGGVIRRVLSSLTLNPTGRTTSFKREKGNRKGQAYFAVRTKNAGLSPGIYERRASGFGNLIRKLWGFVTGVNYRKTFPFYDIGQKAARDKIVEKVKEGIEKGL